LTSFNKLLCGFTSRDDLSSTTFNFSPSPIVLVSNQINSTRGWYANTRQIIDPTATHWSGYNLIWLYQYRKIFGVIRMKAKALGRLLTAAIGKNARAADPVYPIYDRASQAFEQRECLSAAGASLRSMILKLRLWYRVSQVAQVF
jgi:hypothetical protein